MDYETSIWLPTTATGIEIKVTIKNGGIKMSDILDEIARDSYVSTPDYDALKVYINQIAEMNKNIGFSDHPLLCKKCKSNAWNMLKKKTSLRLEATCINCLNKQVLIKTNPKESFIEVKL